jgi:hypothetical protein
VYEEIDQKRQTALFFAAAMNENGRIDFLPGRYVNSYKPPFNQAFLISFLVSSLEAA